MDIFRMNMTIKYGVVQTVVMTYFLYNLNACEFIEHISYDVQYCIHY